MKTVLITGATGGLGTAVTSALTREYLCIALYHSPDSFERLKREAAEDLLGLPVDLADPQSVSGAVEKAATISGPLYGVVHLVGGFAPGKLADTTFDTWKQMLDLNLTGAFLVIRESIPHLRSNGEGRIVAIGSEAVLTKPPGVGAYTISKSALALMIQLWAQELRADRITANILLPGALDTPTMREEMDRSKLVPLPRVADTIVYLLSAEAAGVTGAMIPLTA